MERLTDNTDYCTSWSDCDMPEGKCVFLQNCYDRKLYNKLKEYEDAEEQGLLLRLPCKVGDTLYEASRQWETVITRTVAAIVICNNSIWIRNGCGDSFEYGVEVFLTKAEAEAALERIKENAI